MLPGCPGLRCRPLDDELAPLLVERTLDERDVLLREMTHDLDRFSSLEKLARWKRNRDALCLVEDATGSLLGIVWVAEKPMPKRGDYIDPELMRQRGPHLTFAVRLYGPVRGHGIALLFTEYALNKLLTNRGGSRSLWFQTKANNKSARSVGLQLGFFEASGEESSTVVGVRFSGRDTVSNRA